MKQRMLEQSEKPVNSAQTLAGKLVDEAQRLSPNHTAIVILVEDDNPRAVDVATYFDRQDVPRILRAIARTFEVSSMD